MAYRARLASAVADEVPDSQHEQTGPDIKRIVDAAREVWIRRLIDHSRGNSLLFFRDLKVGTLDLSYHPEAVSRLLAGDRMGVDALLPPVSNEAERERDEARSRLQHVLVAIQRKSITNHEEKGIETLFLAHGMATWRTIDGGRPYNAPVVLMPARIVSRGRSGDDLHLVVSGEPELNPVLLYVLEKEFGAKISAESVLEECAAEDEAGQWAVDTACVFERINQGAKSVPDFAVNPRVVLGNFQFAKMAMVEDLRRNGDALAANPVVAAIAGHGESREQLARSVIDVDLTSLDERLAEDDFLVLDADSTQQRAVVLACRGQNGVIQGPPGTGKSQTIANLIAQSVAEGKRVLFVAEKRAALDAVMKRLNHADVGLGHLVLDLHGASVSRREVMARLTESLEYIRHARLVDDAEGVHREFESRRRQLNEHARRVNIVREPAGLSINQILGRLLRLPDAAKSGLRLRGSILMALESARFDEVKQWVRDGAAQPTLLLGTDPSPWNNANIDDGMNAQLLLDKIMHVATDTWPSFEALLGEVVAKAGIRSPETLDSVDRALGVLRDVRRVLKRYDEAVFESRPGDMVKEFAAADSGRLRRMWAFVTDGRYRAARSRLRRLRHEVAPAPTLLREARQATDVLERWRELSPADGKPRDVKGSVELEAAYDALRDALIPFEQILKGDPFGSMSVCGAADRIRSLARDQRTPYQLPVVLHIRQRLRDAGLGAFLDDLTDNEVAPEHWAARFEYVWLHSTLDSVLASDPALASFNGRTHEQLVADFVHLDRERLRLAARRVGRLAAEWAVRAMNEHYEQTDLVRREANKRSRHIALRKLFAKAPDVLTRIAPCWVASPLSVSQLLDSGQRHFDLVIFDEASQVLQEEAVPSLYRASQVVVAGDRHQLPPTTFFATVVEGEDDVSGEGEESQLAWETATEAIGGFESLLGTLEVFLPNWMLEWHYRSEDERLIAFSNEHIYGGRLVTFPSARAHEAIRHVHVPHDPALGAQEESASREVDQVVQLVLEHVQLHPLESLGVITMGIKHANRVQAALDRALDLRPDLADFFELQKEERFFVKNLETVQGDERDAVILTVGYGKTTNGDLPHRFGPLTQETGHRRLNVAVTRARRRMTLVSSFTHNEVDLERSGSRGVQLLKAYLEYAASGGKRLRAAETAGGVPLNAFESDVRDALEARGIRTRPQFGASRYRIDLVAMHPEQHGRPVLAVECDGASYHSCATARDRDRLRQAHLMRLGWRFHRIWSTDWFFSREQEIERAVLAYEDAVKRADADEDDAAANRTERPTVSPGPTQTPDPQRRNPRPPIRNRDSIDQYTNRELRRIVEWVVSDRLLRTEEEIIREAFATLPFERLGARIRKRLATAARSVHHSGMQRD